MRKIAASLLAALPLLAAAQESQPPAQSASPPAQQAAPPPQYPPQYAPAPQYTPPPPQYAPAPQYAPPQQPYQRPARQRGPWYIGFGLGGGNGSIKDAAGTSSFKEFLGKSPTTVSLNFKVGATLTPKLLLGFDLSGISSGASEGTAEATVSIANYDAMVTFFPVGRGLFVRGGAGLSRFTIDVSSPLVSGSESFTGSNLTAGAGYAFWLGQAFNLTVNLDFSRQGWGDNNGGTTGPQSSSYWALGLGFDWY